MEDARVVVSTSWQQRLQNEKYKNWLKVTNALSKTCSGTRPYIEREAKAFHATLTTTLHGLPLCACTHRPRRRPNPYHDMGNCAWARELERYHAKRKPTWNQSDASLWHDPNVGHWEVAKLYMPYGCAKGNSCAETDATGLLNLLRWCSYYKIDTTLVERLKDTRNAWAHAATQELDAAETIDAFLSMKNFLQDAELIGDADATDALNDIIALEIDDLIDFEDLETKVVKELKESMTCMKDELVAKIDSMIDQEDIHANEIKDDILHVKTMISYCMNVGQEREDVLLNVLSDMQDQIEILVQSRLDSRNEERSSEESTVMAMKHSLKHLSLWPIILLLKVMRTIPRKVTLLIFLLAAITTLDENLDEIGCARLAHYNPLMVKEIDFIEHLNRARERFVGRQWLFKDMSDSLEKDEFKGVMVIATPGFGKSALVSNLICSRLSSFLLHSQILGYHLCIHSHKNTQNGAKFIRNLANMIAHSLQDYERLVMSNTFIQRVLNHEQCSSDPTGCFEQAILSPLLKLPLRFLKTMYIVIDALDECYNENDQDRGTSIVNILSNNMKMFPKWLKVIVTSRNVTDIRRKFSSLDFIELLSDDPRNLQDIENFILLQPEIKSFFAVEDFSIQAMVNKSQGNFLYIKLVLEYLKSKGFEVGTKSWNSLPTSINSIYQEFFERKFETKDKFRGPREIFEILVATLFPLTTEELYDVLLTKHKNPNEHFHFVYDFLMMLEDLSMYLSSTQENQIVTVFHNSLTEWLTSGSNKGGKFFVEEKEGNRLLADYYFKRIGEKSIDISTQLVHDLASYVIKGKLPQHEKRFKDLNPKIVKTTDHRSNFTALHLAATSDNKKILEILLPFFQNVDCKESSGHTPAFFAVTSGNLDTLRLLYERGASLDQVTKALPLSSGIPKEQFEIMKDCKLQMCGYTLLHVAAQKGHVDVLEFLLANNVNISSLSGTGSSPIHLASEFGHTKVMKSLLKHGAVADNLCLYYDALRGKDDAVRLLLGHGVTDNCIDCIDTNQGHLGKSGTRMSYDNYTRHCNTALHAAVIGDFPNVIEVLLASKNNALKCINYYGREPLHEAVQHNNYKAAKVLLDFKANSSSVCKFIPLNSLHLPQQFCPCGYTPLHLAAHHGFALITSLLLEHNADYNATDCEGLQPIHVASCQGHGDVISVLVEHGADINSKGPNDMTPIHFACECHAEKVYETLFNLGADGFSESKNVKLPVNFLFHGKIIDKEIFFVDPYVDKPIDPIDDESASKAPGMFKFEPDSWFRSFAKYLESFITLTGDLHKVKRMLVHMSLEERFWAETNSTEFLIDLLGSKSYSKTKILFKASPIVPFVFDLAYGPILQRYYLDKLRTKSGLPSILKTVVKRTVLGSNCSRLLQLLKLNAVYAVDAVIDIGTDVNCKTETGLSPLLTYLRQGGRNMAKVLVKHGVIIDVQCGEFFEDSAFHLAAYHKLHYLQYTSVFRDPVKWEEYLKEENALFDYLFDEYDKITVGEQVKVVKVRDGPVTKAIKSHPRGYKIIDECLDDEGYTALHRAAQGGNFVAVEQFLNWGANATKENSEGLNTLTLVILYAVKYRPYLNLHKFSLLTSLEIEFASLTAEFILYKLTDVKAFDVGCGDTRNSLTLLHLAATRGMCRFIDYLFFARDRNRVTGLTANCPTKDNITPIYLAILYVGDNCDWNNPWCKAVTILLKYGASMIYPDKITEYHIIFNALFHGFPGRLDIVLSLEDLMNLRDSCGQQECLQFKDNPTKESNLLNELQQGYQTQRPCDCCIRKLDVVLQVAAWKLRSKVKEIVLIKDDYLNFVSQSIDDIKQLIIAGVIKGDENLKECKPMKTNVTTQSVTPSNLDMCSERTTIHINEVEAKLRKKYRAYKNIHQSLKEELADIRKILSKILTAKCIEPERYQDLNKACYLFERKYLCEWQSLTFKFAHLKFLLHILDSWQKQVKRNRQYPSVSPFATHRIENLFLNSNRREMIELMIKLSKEDPSKDYKYLEMLQFHKPPMFNDF